VDNLLNSEFAAFFPEKDKSSNVTDLKPLNSCGL
jgi:hypothetical protein